jgi:hypothetical protein
MGDNCAQVGFVPEASSDDTTDNCKTHYCPSQQQCWCLLLHALVIVLLPWPACWESIAACICSTIQKKNVKKRNVPCMSHLHSTSHVVPRGTPMGHRWDVPCTHPKPPFSTSLEHPITRPITRPIWCLGHAVKDVLGSGVPSHPVYKVSH